jgi:hypothetical protein
MDTTPPRFVELFKGCGYCISMNWKVGFKAVTLSIALTATLYSMYLLKSHHATDFFTSLGFSSSRTLTWCPDRLLKLEGLSASWTLESIERKWVLSGIQQQPVFIDPLDMEKWLARYCTIKIEPLSREKILELKLNPSARFIFNDGQKTLLYQKDQRIFQMNEITFESQEFQQALVQLSQLLKISF